MSVDPQPPAPPVRIVDFDMPFGSMVLLMIKWTVAAVPALIVLSILGFLAFAMLSGMLVGLTR